MKVKAVIKTIGLMGKMQKHNRDLWNDNNYEDENQGCFSSITGQSFVGFIGILIVVVLATFGLLLLEKVVQFIFPIVVVAGVIALLSHLFRK